MKMLWVFCNESISEEVMEKLDSHGVMGYFVLRDVLSRDNKNRPNSHWDDAVFPGRCWALMTVGPDQEIIEVFEVLRAFQRKDYVRQAGLRAVIQKMDDYF